LQLIKLKNNQLHLREFLFDVQPNNTIGSRRVFAPRSTEHGVVKVFDVLLPLLLPLLELQHRLELLVVGRKLTPANGARTRLQNKLKPFHVHLKFLSRW
jgi:hypothetical protein